MSGMLIIIGVILYVLSIAVLLAILGFRRSTEPRDDEDASGLESPFNRTRRGNEDAAKQGDGTARIGRRG